MKKIQYTLMAVVITLNIYSQGITTVAGNGTLGYSGDGGVATAAELDTPYGTCFDASGNLYIADAVNHRIRKVDNVTGIITTFAGTGTAGYSGDGASAVSAQFNRPTDLAIDASGNMYISDELNFVVRKINASGIVSTYAGTGTSGYTGDGGQATSATLSRVNTISIDNSGNIYISVYQNNAIRKITTAGIITTVAGNGTAGFSGDGGIATAAELNEPCKVAIDNSGNLYIADEYNQRIRKVNAAGIITTVVGNGTAGFSGDGGAASSASINYCEYVNVDVSGNLYIADKANSRIRKVDASGIITTIAGTGTQGYSGDGGPATLATFKLPQAMTLDAYNNMYITDGGNNVVRKICASLYVSISQMPLCSDSSKIVLTATGTSTSYAWSTNAGSATTNTVLVSPTVTTTYSVTGTNDGCSITRINTVYINSGFYQPIITTVAGNGTLGYSGDGGISTAAELDTPYGTCFDALGNLYIADAVNHRIRKVDNVTGIITTFAGTGTAGYSGDGASAVSAQFNRPTDLAIDASGNMYVSDELNFVVRKINTSGIISTYAGTHTSGYTGDGGQATSATLSRVNTISIDNSGNIYISVYQNNAIRKITTAGIITTVAGNGTAGFSGDGGIATAAKLNEPCKVAIDNSGNIYIADEYNQRIRKVNASGIITTVVGNGTAGFSGDGGAASSASINYCEYVNVDVSGNLYVADKANNRIRKVDASGIITTIAGTGTQGYSGDGGPATLATFKLPQAMTLDAYNNMYITDGGNNVVRKIANECSTGGMPTGTNNLSNYYNGILVYPNPSSSSVKVELNAANSSKYKLYNIMGQEVKKGNFNDKVNQLDIDELNSGIYTLVVFQEDNQLISKIIIQK